MCSDGGNQTVALKNPLQKPENLENTSILYVNLSVVLENKDESILELLE